MSICKGKLENKTWLKVALKKYSFNEKVHFNLSFLYDPGKKCAHRCFLHCWIEFIILACEQLECWKASGSEEIFLDLDNTDIWNLLSKGPKADLKYATYH